MSSSATGNNSVGTMGYAITCPPMLPVSDWYLYLLPSIGIYFGGLLLLLLYNAIFWSSSKAQAKRNKLARTGFLRSLLNSSLRQFLDTCSTGNNKLGFSLLILNFSLSITSYMLYLVDSSLTGDTIPIEYCINWFQSPLLQIDFGFNMFFFMYFIFRATIPTSVTYLAYNRYWGDCPGRKSMGTCLLLGIFVCVLLRFFCSLSETELFSISANRQEYHLSKRRKDKIATYATLRFFRIIYLNQLPELAEKAGILKNATYIRVITLATRFISFWLASAGFVHLLENSGDPWMNRFNGQNLGYWECVYFMVVTASTVGYGDVTCVTVLGQLFDCLYIFVGLAMFTNALPEVLNIINLTSPYNGIFRTADGKRHVVVCGHIVTSTASKFVARFLHSDWNVNDLVVVFLHPTYPTLDFEVILKHHENNVFYICGSEMRASDLERVSFSDADACIILANQFADDPDDEDSANIMRAVSIKNFSAHTRIMIQLLLEENKRNLNNVPNWSSLDTVVCLDEIKMGMLAINCWAPGFSTLLSLMLTQMDESKQDGAQLSLRSAYLHGVGLEVYENELSPDFVGKNFCEVAEFCFSTLKIVMFAISTGEKSVLCPGKNYLIRAGDSGFFVADAKDRVKCAFNYCKECHVNQAFSEITKCDCESRKRHSQYLSTSTIVMQDLAQSTTSISGITNFDRVPTNGAQNGAKLIEHAKAVTLDIPHSDKPMLVPKKNQPHHQERPHHAIANEQFDLTGMFYWCPARRFYDVVCNVEHIKRLDLQDHVVLCLFGDPGSPKIGLRNFIMPLRASNRHPAELMPIVIIGNSSYIVNEWHSISTFPGIHIVDDSPLNRYVLRACNIDKCKMCVVASARKRETDPILMDKQAILAYLNIKAMKFDSRIITSFDREGPLSQALALLKSKFVDRVPAKSAPLLTKRKLESAAPIIANSVPIIVDVFVQENVLILDDDVTHTTRTPLQLMTPFACANVFAGDVLNNVISTAYYSPNTLNLTRELITGGSTQETEFLFAEGLGLVEGNEDSMIQVNRSRARVSEFFLTDDNYSGYARHNCTFHELFIGVLRKFEYVCLGVCRLRDNIVEDEQSDRIHDKRMVILSPPTNFILHPTDSILCLKPFYPS